MSGERIVLYADNSKVWRDTVEKRISELGVCIKTMTIDEAMDVMEGETSFSHAMIAECEPHESIWSLVVMCVASGVKTKVTSLDYKFDALARDKRVDFVDKFDIAESISDWMGSVEWLLQMCLLK